MAILSSLAYISTVDYKNAAVVAKHETEMVFTMVLVASEVSIGSMTMSILPVVVAIMRTKITHALLGLTT